MRFYNFTIANTKTKHIAVIWGRNLDEAFRLSAYALAQQDWKVIFTEEIDF